VEFYLILSNRVFEIVENFLENVTRPLLAVVGPTASGKTEVSIRVAEKFDGEIINSDSRQMYEFLDISTAKITESEARKIPHHLFSFLKPDEKFSVAQWKTLAEKKTREILLREKLPILCGGTGFFVNSLVENYKFISAARDETFRENLEEFSTAELWEKFCEELKKFRGEFPKKIGPHDRAKIIRGLEILLKNSVAPRDKKTRPEFESLILGIAVRRDEIYEKINLRVLQMLENGLLAEVENLLKMGFKKSDPGMISHGVPECVDFLRGEISRAEFISKMQQNTRNFAKRQLTWWRRNSNVVWFDPRNFEIVQNCELP